jgi:hypothetical protein
MAPKKAGGMGGHSVVPRAERSGDHSAGRTAGEKVHPMAALKAGWKAACSAFRSVATRATRTAALTAAPTVAQKDANWAAMSVAHWAVWTASLTAASLVYCWVALTVEH